MATSPIINAVSAIGGTDANAILAALLATVSGPPNSTPFTWSGLGQELLKVGVSPTIVLNARATLANLENGGPMLDGCLSSGGFDCSDATNRALLAASEVTDPPDAVTIINAMLAIGLPTFPMWQEFGLTEAPILSDVQTALAQISNQQAWESFVASTLNALLTSYASPTTIKAAVDAWSPS